MGDPLTVALFWVAFLPSTIRWQQQVAAEGAESEQLLAWHPWSGARMDLSLSQYADDTTKQIGCLVISRVVNTALSGIEAFCPSKAQYQVFTFGLLGNVRRLKWAQTLVQNLAHDAQLITALFGKLPAEQQATLGENGEISRDALGGTGIDVRVFLLDRELATDFIAMDVTILRLQSLAVQVPPWSFQEVAGHPSELSEEGVPQWRCCLRRSVKRASGFKALATHVLRHQRQMETVSRLVVTNQCPACCGIYGDRNAAHRHLLSSIRRGCVGVVSVLGRRERLRYPTLSALRHKK